MYRPKTPTSSVRLFRGTLGSPAPATPKAYDPEEAQALLQALVPHADQRLDALTPAAEEAYTAVSRFAKGLYASESYKEFYEMAQKAFDSTKGRTGTVAAYIQGCQFSTDVLPGGCSVVCQGALPVPGTAGADLCAHPVLLGEVFDGAYRFTPLHGQRTGLSRTALVFVPPGFKGFAEGERQALLRYGDQFHVYELDDDGTYTAVPDGGARSRGGLPVLARGAPAPQVVESYYLLVLVVIALALMIIGFAFLNSDVRFFRSA